MDPNQLSVFAYYTNIQALLVGSIKVNQQLITELEDAAQRDQKIAQQILEMLSSLSKSRSTWRHPFSLHWWDTIVPQLPENLFRRHFRVDRSVFKYLVLKLGNSLYTQDTAYREAIPVGKKIAIALKLLGTTSDYLTIAALFGVGRSTAHRCFKDFVSAVNTVLVPEEIKFPRTEDDFGRIAQDFETLWQFPMIVGAIDGSHIPFRAPVRLSGDFYNYKGWTSVVLLAICDAKGRAIWIKSGIPGRHSDSGAFKSTDLYKQIAHNGYFPSFVRNMEGTDIPYMLLGDSGFGLERWLMKPFTHHTHLSADKITFNYRLSRARRVVENFFGRLKGRFRRLYRGVDVQYADAHLVINAAVALHNICETRGVNITCTALEMTENQELLRLRPQPQSVSTQRIPEAENIRSALVTLFSSQNQPW